MFSNSKKALKIVTHLSEKLVDNKIFFSKSAPQKHSEIKWGKFKKKKKKNFFLNWPKFLDGFYVPKYRVFTKTHILTDGSKISI